MRVAFDALWWADGPPSGRNVIRGIVGAWPSVFPDDAIHLLVRRGSATRLQQEFPSARVVEAPGPRLPHAIQARALRRIAPHVDAVITNNFGIGPMDAQSVVILYDTIFVRHPEWFTRLERLYLARIRRSLRHADVIVTGAQSEVDATLKVWPELGQRMSATDYGISDELLVAAASPVDGVQGDFVLSVGRFNVRKNLERLVKAFSTSLIASTHQLVIVGPRDGLPPDLTVDPAISHAIVMPGSVSAGGLRWLYEHAAALAFPSLDEGYGLPMIEAAAFGLPVIASDIPSLREVGSAARYFDPHDTVAMKEALDAVPTLVRTSPRAPTAWTDVVRSIRERIHMGT